MKGILPLVFLACFPNVANAADSVLEPDCPIPAGLQSTQSLADLPAPVIAALREHVPNLAPADAPFNGGDALLLGQTQLDRRFVSAIHKGTRWAVAYEAAGRGVHDNVVALQLSSDMQSAQVVANTQALGPAICTELLRGINPDFPVSRYW